MLGEDVELDEAVSQQYDVRFGKQQAKDMNSDTRQDLSEATVASGQEAILSRSC